METGKETLKKKFSGRKVKRTAPKATDTPAPKKAAKPEAPAETSPDQEKPSAPGHGIEPENIYNEETEFKNPAPSEKKTEYADDLDEAELDAIIQDEEETEDDDENENDDDDDNEEELESAGSAGGNELSPKETAEMCVNFFDASATMGLKRLYNFKRIGKKERRKQAKRLYLKFLYDKGTLQAMTPEEKDLLSDYRELLSELKELPMSNDMKRQFMIPLSKMIKKRGGSIPPEILLLMALTNYGAEKVLPAFID
jgi:hypothetical protein